MRKNIITKTDSYKLTHHQQYQPDTEVVYSYFEARKGAEFDETVFFGLQYLLKEYLEGVVVSKSKIDFAEALVEDHLGDKKLFNRKMWEHILESHDGKLPIRIKAVPEGTVVPIDNVMMTVENTCPHCAPLTNHLETLLCHVWHACTVATLSREVKKMIRMYMDQSSDGMDALDFMLHDFGFRGVSSVEAAAIGGLAHLVNFKGTDTVAALEAAMEYYNHYGAHAGYSVPATEHSVMTSLGPDGEEKVIGQLLDAYPTGILSVVSDSYDIYGTVENIIGGTYRERILERDGVFVVRPDSGNPKEVMLRLLETLWKKFGGRINGRGYKVINPKIKLLWGDGLDLWGIELILVAMMENGWSIDNVATFGMGGGLLQKVHRDTQRFAFKCSAQKRDGVWHDIYKDPKDSTKASKRGCLKLLRGAHGFSTVRQDCGGEDQLVTVFENGEVKKEWTLQEIRVRAQL